ncbi:hypothetical protein F4604DRAFT_1922779 [Suillus subluteus]|nr:hypothetical protein F4604DRAFT_1922779 [Suillus subluteus]
MIIAKLCNPATGEPITIWVVGRIGKMWFTKFGNPESQASLTIMPLSKSLGQQSVTLLAKMSSPALNINQQSMQVIHTIKWQNGKRNDGETEAILFDAVYDVRAEGSLKTYSEWPLWKLGDLKPGDLVLLEMKMTRYSKKYEEKWHSRAQYEMIAISLLDITDITEEETQADIEKEGTHTHRQISDIITKEYPDCVLKVKQIKQLQAQIKSEALPTACVAAKISNHMALSTSITQGLLLLLASLLPIRLTRPTSNLHALQMIERLLPAGEPQELLILYPKEKYITHWYYHIYFTSTPDDDRVLHPALLEIFGKRRPRGEVVIVKNSEEFAPDSPAFDLDCEDLGKTLWWYIKSGRDPVEEASERRLMHYIQQL